MPRTKFEEQNAEFSQKAHRIARQEIYPFLFGAHPSQLHYEAKEGTEWDMAWGIDKFVHLECSRFEHSINKTYWIQERFRKHEKVGFQDLTITLWSHASNLPSEYYKIKADFFIYGYLNHQQTSFHSWIAIDVSISILKIQRGLLIPHEIQPNPKDQDFLCFRFDDLFNAGVVLMSRNITKPSSKNPY